MLAEPFNLSKVATQAQRSMFLVNKAHDYQAGHEPEVAAFKAELDGDKERFEVLKARSQRDTPEDLAMLVSLFLRSIVRRNAGLATACLAGVEAIAAEATEDAGGSEHAAS